MKRIGTKELIGGQEIYMVLDDKIYTYIGFMCRDFNDGGKLYFRGVKQKFSGGENINVTIFPNEMADKQIYLIEL